MLVKKIKEDLNRHSPCSLTEKLNMICQFSPKSLLHRFKTISFKIYQEDFVVDVDTSHGKKMEPE